MSAALPQPALLWTNAFTHTKHNYPANYLAETPVQFNSNLFPIEGVYIGSVYVC